MERFILRDTARTLAEGLLCTNGKCVVCWQTERDAMTVHSNVGELMDAINGRYELRWVDRPKSHAVEAYALGEPSTPTSKEYGRRIDDLESSLRDAWRPTIWSSVELGK